MSDKEPVKKQKIELSKNKEVTKYSSDLIKRGLDLAITIQNDSSDSNELILISELERDRDGLNCIMNEDYKKALVFFESALDINPQDAEAWYLSGYCHYKLHNSSEAVKFLERQSI